MAYKGLIGIKDSCNSFQEFLSYHISPDELAPTVGTGHLSVPNNSIKSSVFPLLRVASPHWVEPTYYSLVHDVILRYYIL